MPILLCYYGLIRFGSSNIFQQTLKEFERFCNTEYKANVEPKSFRAHMLTAKHHSNGFD
eukprot:m.238608 g.238608  ORF g.238608 m.238608 type:complete len:59 (+) comp40167_c1_seq1:40-216(+)